MEPPIKILYIEDLASDVELTNRELKKANVSYSMKVADTEEEFLDGLTHFEPDIIFSDHSLPQFNSMEALRITRSLGYYIPFILLTGAVSEEFAVECMKAGADDYILKSNLIRLPVSLRNILAKKRSW